MRKRQISVLIMIMSLLLFILVPSNANAFLPSSQTDGEVGNIPPVTSFGVVKQKNIDLYFNLNNTGYSQSYVQSRVNAVLVPSLTANNINANIQYVSTPAQLENRFYYLYDVVTGYTCHTNCTNRYLNMYDPSTGVNKQIAPWTVGYAAIGPDGKVYFNRGEDSFPSYPYGGLYVYDPNTDTVTTLINSTVYVGQLSVNKNGIIGYIDGFNNVPHSYNPASNTNNTAPNPYNYTFSNIFAASDGNFYVYQSGTWPYQIYRYDPLANTLTNVGNTNGGGYVPSPTLPLFYVSMYMFPYLGISYLSGGGDYQKGGSYATSIAVTMDGSKVYYEANDRYMGGGLVGLVVTPSSGGSETLLDGTSNMVLFESETSDHKIYYTGSYGGYLYYVDTTTNQITKTSAVVPNSPSSIGVVNHSFTPTYRSSYSIDTPLRSANWSSNKLHFFADISDNHIKDLDDTTKTGDILSRLLSNSVSFYGLGNGNNQSQYQNLIAQNNGSGGSYFDNSNLDSALTNMANSIIPQVNAAASVQKYLLQNDCLNYNINYTDYEHDGKNAERWIFTHNPNFYENNQGIISNSGQYLSSPITCFPKVGQYIVQYEAQDNPKNDGRFTNYWLWSLGTNNMVLYVLRKPIAVFTATSNSSGNITYTQSSYDLDHYSQINNGIQEYQWSWKQVGSASWNSGQPGWLTPGNTYLIQLRVRNMENYWSDPLVLPVSTGGSDLPPVALFQVNPYSTYLYGDFTLTDQSYDPDGQAITSRVWTVQKDGVQIYSGTATPSGPNLRSWASGSGVAQQGTYSITETVQDAGGLQSAPYTQYEELTIHGPSPSFEAPSTVTRDQVVSVTNTTPNPDMDGSWVSFHWYAILNGSQTYDLGTTTNPSFIFRNLGLGKNAVSPNWQIKLVATDGNGNSNFTMKTINVVNQNPVASASGPTSGNINQSYTYVSGAYDPDSEDNSSLQYYFTLISPSGITTQYNGSSITPTFTESGTYTLKHYVIDQLGALSNTYTMTISISSSALPTAGFTVSPNPAYRITTVNINSTAYDNNPGGYINTYNYYVTPPGGSEYWVSNANNWTYKFNALGNWGIRQVVCNKLGLCAQATGSITILDLPPTVTLTNPTSMDVNNPTADTPPFSITWNYSDPENDTQRSYEVQIYNTSTNVKVVDSGIVNSSATSYYVASGVLAMGTTYYSTVTAWDAYGSQSNTDTRYFITDRPPSATMTYPNGTQTNPTVVYTARPTLTWYQTDPDVPTTYTLAEIQIVDATNTTVYIDKTITQNTTSNNGSWAMDQDLPLENTKLRVRVRVSDGYLWSTWSPDTWIYFNNNHVYTWGVNHNAAFEAARVRNGRTSDEFYAGEPMEAYITGHNLATVTATFPMGYPQVDLPDMVLDDTSNRRPSLAQTITLVGGQAAMNGEGWLKTWPYIPDGTYTVTFNVTYQDGEQTSKTATVTILNSVIDKFTPGGSDY